MEHTISATDLVRRLGDVLAKIRYRHDSFVVERNGMAVARLVPIGASTSSTVREALESWCEVGDRSFADDLERIGSQDTLPVNPWASS